MAPLLAAMSMVGPFSIDTMFPAFHTIEHEFGISPMAMQQSVSIYLAAFAFMALLHGALSDAFGRRSVLLTGMTIFGLASIGCALAPSLPVLLTFRAMQGLSAGAGMIIGRAIIRDRFEGAEATRLMSQVTLIFGIAPAIAPVFGGWMLDLHGWRAIFWSLVIYSIAIVGLCLIALPETHPRARRVRFSVGSLARGYRDVLMDRRCVLLALSGALNFGAVFLYIASAPVIVLDWLRLDERQFAWLFVPTISGIMFGAWLAGRLAGVIRAEGVVRLGFIMVAAGSVFSFAVYRYLPPQLPWTVLPPGIVAIGSALCAPTVTLLMLDRFPLLRGTVASLQASISIGFNALGSGLISPLVAARPAALSATSALISLGALLMWLWYRRLPAEPAAVAVPLAADLPAPGR